jgi:hypothetical protein
MSDTLDVSEKVCTICLLKKTVKDFHKGYKKCKPCANKETASKVKTFKIQCVRYKGRECEHCGYDKCLAALEFHHRDPAKKDFAISTKKCGKFSQVIREELDKCLLLCCRCHREEHERLRQI